MSVNRFGMVTFGFDKPGSHDLSQKKYRAVYLTFGLLNRAIGEAIEEIKLAIRGASGRKKMYAAAKEVAEREKEMEKKLPIRVIRSRLIKRKI